MKRAKLYLAFIASITSGLANAANGYIYTTPVPPAYESSANQRVLRTNEETSTYIKCVYNIDNQDQSNPASSWTWARDGSNYLKLRGYWYSATPLANMFYSESSYASLMNICRSTLKASNINAETVIPYASDYTLSWFYMIWHQGQAQPAIMFGNNKIDRMVIFGDSLSDTINVYNGSYGTVPNHASWFLGHFSNGKVWHEYLSGSLNLPGYVWATANAESGEKPLFNGFDKQLDSFSAYLGKTENYDIAQTLFTVLFGGNDFITGAKMPDDIIATYRVQLARLAALGAQHIAIFRLPDFSVIPNVATWTPAEKEALKNKSENFNQQLDQLLGELRTAYPKTNFFTVKLDSAFNDLLSESGKYGFVNTSETCLDISASGISYATGVAVKQTCKAANGAFVFWDNMHPTTKTHALLAEMIREEIVQHLTNGGE
ncbi:SGNH/GDSL hydrolase family protein [Kosakonia sp. R1.Fl]|uniref:SGNH/GDSL hydrolase family protein n=1 Tax=Kosakonia sp. R1.Fl TaxID=2928706 RepID=UPI00201E6905|nr:SGNH/GDSL hydrolase family protein [Kosakonia sp. R1.Fl]MCL6744531.1 SGNH/GDSL hydrolase family protein [Kosakonia sp. R1.Fl]